ncbi:MAG: glycosyltransferase family 2 protein [Fidelibacterota bacterium]
MEISASIIIPTYNNLENLKCLLKSFENQTVPGEKYEIIVVDDGSTDGTREFITERIKSYPIKYIRHAENKGLPAARNSGIKSSAGAVLIFIDSDMEVVDDFIKEHLKLLNFDNHAGFVGNVKQKIKMKDSKFSKFLNRKNRGARGFREGETIPCKMVLFGNASIKRELIYEAGFFDERIRGYGGHEIDFAARLYALGKGGFVFNPRAISYHRHERDFESTLKLLEDFGRGTLGYIISKNPHLKYDYNVHLLEKMDFRKDGLRTAIGKIFMKLLLKDCTASLSLKIYTHFPSFISNLIIKFLLGYHILKGYIKKHVSSSRFTPGRG